MHDKLEVLQKVEVCPKYAIWLFIQLLPFRRLQDSTNTVNKDEQTAHYIQVLPM